MNKQDTVGIAKVVDTNFVAEQNVHQRLEDISRNYPNYIAIRDDRRAPLSFLNLIQVFEDVRKSVAQYGVVEGMCVGIWLECRADLAVLVAGLCKSFVVMPFSNSMSDAELERVFATLNISVFISDGSHSDAIQAHLSKATVAQLLVRRSSQAEWRYQFDQKETTAIVKKEFSNSNGLALVLITSGSSGTAKIVTVSHRAILLTTVRSARGLELKPGEMTLNVMALNHVHGLISGLFLPWMSAGCSVLIDRYTANFFLESYCRNLPHWFSVSPAIYADILRHAKGKNIDLKQPNLRFVRCGSAALSTDLAGQIEHAFQVPLLEAYGMSETLQIAGVPFSSPRRGSVGKSVADNIMIIGDDKVACGRNAVGEICITGETVSPSVSSCDFAINTKDRFFRTGDLGVIDTDGFLFITGRLSDRVNIGGEMVSLKEVESVISSLVGVDQCVCIIQQHTTLGEVLAAAITLNDDHDLTLPEIIHTVRTKLPAIKVPNYYKLLDQMPLTTSGKVDRKKLIDMSWEKHRGNGEVVDINDPVERWLAKEFCRVLKTSNILIDDDFFSLGGSSLDVVELIERMEVALTARIHPTLFFSATTVKQFASVLRQHYYKQLNAFIKEDIGTPIALGSQATIQSAQWPEFMLDGLTDSSELSPVFILSAPRAGSTLLRTMLAGHSKVFSPPELRLLNYTTLSDWANDHSDKYRFFREGVIEALMVAQGQPYEAVLAQLEKMIAQSASVLEIYTLLQNSLGDKLLIDKSPLYSLSIDVLQSIIARFRKPRFIILYRNPHDMIRSYRDSNMEQVWMYGAIENATHFAEKLWARSYRNIEIFKNALHRQQYVQLCFEELVENPNECLERICQYLGIPFESGVLNPYQNSQERMMDGVGGAGRSVGDPNLKKFNKVDCSRAKSGYQLDQSALVESETHDVAVNVGYGIERDITTRHSRLFSQQRQLVKSWQNNAHQETEYIFSRNREADQTPLFWVCQSDFEANSLANQLGENQPVYFMRSAHLLSNKYDIDVRVIGQEYAKQMTQIYSQGPIILGGNCQGAYMAREILRSLACMQRATERLFVMEASFDSYLPTHVVHLFGKHSHLNPLLKTPNIESQWRLQYLSNSTHLIDCKHGQFFSDENSQSLAFWIENHLRKCRD